MPVRFSVIVPARDAGRFIRDALCSVQRAAEGIGLDCVEVVVAEDGSVDDTAAVVERTAAEVPFSVRMVEGPVRGASAARNAAIAASTGDIVVPLDADDLFTPGTLANHLAALEAAGADLTMGGVADFSGEVPDPARTELLVRRGPVPGAMAVHRALLDRIGGFFVGDPLAEWPVTYDRLLRAGAVVTSTPELVLLRRVHDRNMSRGIAGDRSGYARGIKQMLDERRRAAGRA